MPDPQVPCKCGRWMRPGFGHDRCCYCRQNDAKNAKKRKSMEADAARLVEGYTLDEELRIIRRASEAAARGLIPCWAHVSVEDKHSNKPVDRYQIAGAVLTLEEFDDFVCQRLRQRRGVWRAA